MKRRLYLETFGCQMNVLDSELVLGQLQALIHNAVITNSGIGYRVSGIGEGGEFDPNPVFDPEAQTRRETRTPNPEKHIALMGANSRRSSTLAAAEDHLELLDLSRSVS